MTTQRFHTHDLKPAKAKIKSSLFWRDSLHLHDISVISNKIHHHKIHFLGVINSKWKKIEDDTQFEHKIQCPR